MLKSSIDPIAHTKKVNQKKKSGIPIRIFGLAGYFLLPGFSEPIYQSI